MFTLLNHGGVLDYIKLFIPNPKFQQDNCRVHLTSEIRNLLSIYRIDTIANWPSNSPDLNPIEMVWAILKNKVASKLNRNDIVVNTNEEFFQLIKDSFFEIGQETIRNIILKIPFILREVVSLEGEMTKN